MASRGFFNASSPKAAQNLNNSARLWDAASGRDLRQFTGHTGSVSSVTFSPDGRQGQWIRSRSRLGIRGHACSNEADPRGHHDFAD
jgi:WD40 repeat protein